MDRHGRKIVSFLSCGQVKVLIYNVMSIVSMMSMHFL